MRRLMIVLCVAGAACQFDAKIPSATRYTCLADADCPPDLVCHRAERLCVAPLGLGDVAVSAAALRYLPSASNLARAVTAAKADTQVQVDVSFNQPVTCGTLVAAPAGVIAFAALNAEGTMCRYAGTPLPAPAADTPCTLEVTITDGIGAQTTLPVVPSPALRIDTVEPAPPDVNANGGVEYVRAPYGTATAPAGNQVTGAAGTVTPGAVVRVLDAATVVQELARGDADATGAFGPLRLPGDPERVMVMSLDEAGNGSTPVLVHEVVWVATHDGRVAGEPGGNPHVLLARQAQQPQRVLSSEVELSADAGIARIDAQRLEVAGGPGLWLQRGQDLPPGNARFATAFDTRRARLVAVGGPANATYAWNGTDWLQLTTGPAFVATAFAAAYDPRRDRLVVYTGNTGTWEFDGRSVWGRVLTDEVPDVLNQPYLAYDVDLGEVVLVGGGTYVTNAAGSQIFQSNSRAWSFNGVRWRRLAVGGRPGPEWARAAYDPVRGEHVFYGGNSQVTAVWNPTSGTTMRASLGPAFRREHCMVWDEREQKVLLIGGEQPMPIGSPGGTVYDDVWAWSGTGWSPLYEGDGGTLKVAANGAACGFDRSRDEVVIASGEGRGDTRAFRDGQLVQRVGTSLVGPDDGEPAGAEDRVVVALPDAGTMAWANGAWSHLPAAGGPKLRGLIYDPNARRLLSLDYSGTALWALDAGQWALVAPVPATSAWAQLFFDGDAGHPVLDTSSYAAAFRSGEWSPFRDGGSTGGGQTWPAFSGPHGAMVSIRGLGTEVWGGTNWGPLTAGALLPETTGAPSRQLVGDPIARRVLFLAGAGFPATTRPPLSTLTAAGWAVAPTLNTGPNFYLSGATYDHVAHRLWVHDRFGPNDRVWELAQSELRPAIISHFALPQLGAGVATAIRVSAVVGGTGGATTKLWYRSRWVDPSASLSATNSSAPSAPTPVVLTVTDPAQLRELLGEGSQLTVALEPLLENGPAVSTIAADHVELSVRYRLP